MRKIFLLLLSAVVINFSLITGASAAGSLVKSDFDKYFAGYNGTFVLYDENNDRYIVFNDSQSKKRLSPCSTFKIYNSLIGLETGVLNQKDADTLVRWDGTQYSFPAWNHDQTLASATRDSVVWYFQKLATKIGPERMQEYLNKFGYGNRDISGGLTSFWLRSSLQISAREQVDLLHRVYNGKLPVSPDNVEIVKRNITLSENNGIRFMGKTGSGSQNDKGVLGWFVGCVEKEGNRYFFATNIQAADGANGGKAKEITKLILKDLQIL
ncbi:MAG: mecR1 [Firmicutes bacterium]|nr:mecR1 [Bacillota bacterium]